VSGLVPIHKGIRAANDPIGSSSRLLHRLIFAFHDLHDLAKKLLVLIVNLEFPFAVVRIAEELDVRVALRASLVDRFLHVRDGVDHVLVVLRKDEHFRHIPIVVDAVFLLRQHRNIN
jgi:hypothetical protein